MKARNWILFALALTAGQLMSCQREARFRPELAGSFFPLHPGLTWTYRIVNQSQGVSETLKDQVASKPRVVNPKAAGQVESKYAGSSSTGKSTMLYLIEGGYITRVSTVGEPAWVVFEENRFLPQFLKPGLTWSNSLFPFGELPRAFHAVQNHHSFLESSEVVVPAGHFSGCIRIETETQYKDADSQDSESRSLRYIDWYAPNVGLVKTQVMQSGFFGSEIAHVELLNFTDLQVKATPRLVKAESMSTGSTEKSSIASSGSGNNKLR
jgi:hypothetical protein